MTIQSKIIRVLSTLLLIAVCSQLVTNEISFSANSTHRHAHLTKSNKSLKTTLFSGNEEENDDESEKLLAECFVPEFQFEKVLLTPSNEAFTGSNNQCFKFQQRPIWLLDESIIR